MPERASQLQKFALFVTACAYKVLATWDAADGLTVQASADLSHVLPDRVQQLLPRLLERYGHPEDSIGQEAGELLHQLLGTGVEATAVAATSSASRWAAAGTTSAGIARHSEVTTRREHPAGEGAGLQLTRAASRVEAGGAVAGAPREGAGEAPLPSAGGVATEELRELLRKSRASVEAAHRRQGALQERHRKMGEHVAQLLQQVHDQVESDTHGFQDAPLWDDFFRNATTRQHWDLLSLPVLLPALHAAALKSEHRVLVLEPTAALGLAGRIADGIRTSLAPETEAYAFGAEPSSTYDLLLELGLLDAMAMGGSGDGSWRLEELRHATERCSALVKPGGTWVSVSVVPPSLRTPLLLRLAGSTFATPALPVAAGAARSLGAATGTHSVALNASAVGQGSGREPRLRGGLEPQKVANLLLYGHVEPRVFLYRMRRSGAQELPPEEPPPEAEGLASLWSLLAAQRPATREDL